MRDIYLELKSPVGNTTMNISPVTDFLIRVKNGYRASKKTVAAPKSKVKVALSEILKKYGYVTDFTVDDRTITLNLSYDHRTPKVTDITLFSTPGRKVYSGAAALPWGKTSQSLIIISTSKGLMSQREAVKSNIGGEVIAEIY